jgi:hypothetical protein
MASKWQATIALYQKKMKRFSQARHCSISLFNFTVQLDFLVERCEVARIVTNIVIIIIRIRSAKLSCAFDLVDSIVVIGSIGDAPLDVVQRPFHEPRKQLRPDGILLFCFCCFAPQVPHSGQCLCFALA